MPVFNEILTKSGLALQRNGQGVLSVNQVFFIQKCSANLRNHTKYPKVVDDFVQELSDFIEDTKKFRGCLSPTVYDSEDNAHNFGQQDSLIKLLLKVEDVQPKLCQILLEKAVELCADESSTTAESEIPKLILFQFRWLGTLKDSSIFCEKLLEVFSVLNVELQKEIISLIPEIIEDKDHHIIAAAWNEQLKQNLTLALPLLDSLSNLQVPFEILDEMKASAMNLIESIQIEDLAALVKIILQCLTPTDALDMLQEMKLKLNSVFGFKSTSENSSGKKSTEILILDAFYSAVRFQKSMGENLLKLMDPEKIVDLDKFYALDFFLLLMLMSTRTYLRKAEQITVSCIKKGLLTETMLTTVFIHHRQILIEYSKPAQQLAQTLLKKSESVLRNFGGAIYQQSFSQLKEQAIAQQVIMNLIPHVRSGNAVEIDVALDVLLKLAETDPKLVSYGAYLKQLLNYIGTMHLPHVRKIYRVLGHIAHKSQHAVDRSLEDDLHIIIRKQLGHTGRKFRLMGVIGAVNELKMLIERDQDDRLSEFQYKSACDIVVMVESQVKMDYYAKSLFYDELTSLLEVSKADLEFQTWLSERISLEFQNVCTVEAIEDKLLKIPGIRGDLQFELNKFELAINLLAISVGKDKRLEVTERCVDSQLAAMFRLVQVCQNSSKGELEEISAVLGCAVYFISEGCMDRFTMSLEIEQKFMLKCCFNLINFFIELVNAFASQDDEEIRKKVIQRFKMIVLLREKLSEYMPITNFVPFVVRPDVDYEVVTPLKPTGATSSKGAATASGKTGGKKRKAVVGKKKTANKRKKNGDDDCDSDDPVTQSHRTQGGCDGKDSDDQQQKRPKSFAPKINWSSYQACFREFDLEAFFILKAELQPLKSSKSQSPSCLTLQEMLFLYEDFLAKLKAIVEVTQTTVPKRGFPALKPKVDTSVLHRNLLTRTRSVAIDSCFHLLRSCRRHLDSLFINMGIDSDEDASRVTQDLIPNVEEAANLCLIIVNIIEEALDLASTSETYSNTVIKNISPHGTGRSSQEDVIKASKSYLLSLIKKSPGLSLAVAILRCLQKCNSMFPEMDVNFLEVTEGIISMDWTSTDRQLLPIKNPEIAFLLRTWLDASENPLRLIENYISEVQEAALENIDGTGQSLILKKTLHIFCDVFYEKMCQRLESLHKGKRQGKTEDVTADNQYSSWRSGISIFHNLIDLIKTYNTSSILSTSLKRGRRFLYLFNRFCMPLLNARFPSRKEEIMGLLKVLQQSTRLLQNACSHSKVSKNSSLTSHVPPLKKELEGVIFGVKKLLASHKCVNAFWIGSLKNRTLKGEEILSQQSSHDASDEETTNNEEEETNNEEEEVHIKEEVEENGYESSASESKSVGNDVDSEGEDTGYRSECY